MRRYLPFALVGAVLLITVGGGVLLYRSKSSSTPLKIATGQPGAEPAHVRGAANARVTLEEFGDFQCPPCGVLAATLLKVEHDYADSLRVVFRQFPLTAAHQYAMMAACAAEAAGMQGRFWEMHDLLFQNSKVWGRLGPAPTPSPAEGTNNPPADTPQQVLAIFEGYATQLGLDMERFRRDMRSEQVNARIAKDQERGASTGVDRTPFLFIDGVQVPFPSFVENELRGVIDAALAGRPPAFHSPTPAPTAAATPTPAPSN